MKVYIKDSRLILGRFEIPSAQYFIEWNEYVGSNPTVFKLTSIGSGQYIPISIDGYFKITDCQTESGTYYTGYTDFIAAIGSFFVKAFSTAGGDVETRLTNLENNESIYQVFQYTGTNQTGTVTLPTGATFFDPYEDGLPNEVVVKADANNNPLEEVILHGSEVVFVTSFSQITGEYTLSNMPDTAACLLYFIKVTEKDKHYVDQSTIVEILGLNTPAGASSQIQSDWNQTNNLFVDYIKNKPTSFPPSTHSHTLEELSDVNTSLSEVSPVNADAFLVLDSSDSVWKLFTWSNIKTALNSNETTVSGTAILNFMDESDSAIVTILDSGITISSIKNSTFIPTETSETSLDDFSLNGVSFNIENIVDNTSFDIRGTAINNASGNYTIKYIINY